MKTARRALFIPVLLCSLVSGRAAAPHSTDTRSLILVIGAAGTPEYAEQFTNWADLWTQAALQGGLQTCVIGQQEQNPEDDLQRLLVAVTNEVNKSAGELWLVFVGHGTFDGQVAKFNLRGPDLSAEALAAALKPCRRPLAIIQCASGSGAFLQKLSAPGRVIITATRSGYELNATRFAGYLAKAMADPAADLDKDGQVSLLEAYLQASRQVAEFYKDQGRLMTEHSLLDDNGDGLGTPADWFRGVRAVKSAAEGKAVDGVRAHQMFLVRSKQEQNLSPELRARRDELEQWLSALRSRKAQIQEGDYYRQLELLLVETAKLYQSNQAPAPTQSTANPASP